MSLLSNVNNKPPVTFSSGSNLTLSVQIATLDVISYSTTIIPLAYLRKG